MSSAIVEHPLIVVSTFMWIGFVCSISFMEAWLKFRAAGITVALGLGIGRLVFRALNIVEWLLAFSIIVTLLISGNLSVDVRNAFLLSPLIILIIQTLYALPALDARAERRIRGEAVSSSNLHFYYVFMEVLKVICLFLYGIFQFQ